MNERDDERKSETVWILLGFHPDTSPRIVYDEILRLREIARNEAKQAEEIKALKSELAQERLTLKDLPALPEK
jgi:hypothetical protein